VYGAEVVTCRHPVTGTMFLMPVTTANGKVPLPHLLNVQVISGGGSGSDLLRFLTGKGLVLSAGILATTDTDYLTATALEIPCIPVLPFSQIPAHSLEKLKAMLQQADRIILSVHPVGTGNLPVLLLLRELEPERIIIYLPPGTDFHSYDYVKGAAVKAFQELCTAGTQCTTDYDGILSLLNPASRKPATVNEP